MKAIAQDAYGSADVLYLTDIQPPAIGEDEILVRVRAAGVDPGVWHVMSGLPLLVRAMGFGLRTPKVAVRGRDLAGVVEAVGSRVTRFQPGDDVYGTCESGSFAELASAPQRQLARMPANLTFEQSAAVPISGGTALQAVRGGRVKPGQQVLVIGASGGVGSFAVQIAKEHGATVTGVCTTSKIDLVVALGADHVIDYTQTEIDDAGIRYDVIIDTGGNRPTRLLRVALAPRGVLVLVGGENGGGRWLGGFERVLLAPVVSMFSRQHLSGLIAKERAEDLDDLRHLIEAGAVTPHVDRTFPLAEAADAIRYLHQGHARGKVVVTI